MRDPVKWAAARRRWDLAHPEYHKIYQRQEKALQWRREWKKRNPDYPNIQWRRTKEKVFELYGSVCKQCGFSDKRALQLDHVKNDGYKWRVKRKSGKRTTNSQAAWWDAAKNFQPEKYQILCANCNWIKRHEV